MKLIRKVSTVVALALGMVSMLAVAAFAQVATPAPDRVLAQVNSTFGDIETIVIGLIAGLFGLLLVGAAIRVGWKYTRKGASAV